MGTVYCTSHRRSATATGVALALFVVLAAMAMPTARAATTLTVKNNCKSTVQFAYYTFGTVSDIACSGSSQCKIYEWKNIEPGNTYEFTAPPDSNATFPLLVNAGIWGSSGTLDSQQLWSTTTGQIDKSGWTRIDRGVPANLVPTFLERFCGTTPQNTDCFKVGDGIPLANLNWQYQNQSPLYINLWTCNHP